MFFGFNIFWLQYFIVWQGCHLFNASDCSTASPLHAVRQICGYYTAYELVLERWGGAGELWELAAGRLMNIILASIFLASIFFWLQYFLASIFLGFNIFWLQYFMLQYFLSSIFFGFKFLWFRVVAQVKAGDFPPVRSLQPWGAFRGP